MRAPILPNGYEWTRLGRLCVRIFGEHRMNRFAGWLDR